MTRECDNDNCDYETYVNDAGQPRVRWVHDESCAGPVLPPDTEELETRAAAHPDSFLAYLLG